MTTFLEYVTEQGGTEGQREWAEAVDDAIERDARMISIGGKASGKSWLFDRFEEWLRDRPEGRHLPGPLDQQPPEPPQRDG